jgi:hypothetical protein
MWIRWILIRIRNTALGEYKDGCTAGVTESWTAPTRRTRTAWRRRPASVTPPTSGVRLDDVYLAGGSATMTRIAGQIPTLPLTPTPPQPRGYSFLSKISL